jgi:hypothetical protein
VNRFEQLTLPCITVRNEGLSVLCRSPGVLREVDGMPVGHDRERHRRRMEIMLGVLENLHFEDQEDGQNNVDIYIYMC